MANKPRMFAFRISERDYAAIRAKSERARQNMTTYITNAALNKNICVINGLDDTARELKAIGRNLNRLTTLCNMGKIKSLDLNEVKDGLRRVYGALL